MVFLPFGSKFVFEKRPDPMVVVWLFIVAVVRGAIKLLVDSIIEFELAAMTDDEFSKESSAAIF